MTQVPLGKGAYERLYAGAPVVELRNRWLEANPANLREGTSVLARPGTTKIIDRLIPGTFTGYGAMRGNFALSGIFDDSLFVVCGSQLYKIDQNMALMPIIGAIQGTDNPEIAWQVGTGYQRIWISDGQTLQYFDGSSASGVLTKIGVISNGADQFEVGGVYYTWGTAFSDLDSGSAAHPYVVNPNSIAPILDPLNQLVLAIMATGTPGVDYSPTITEPSIIVSATGNAVPATSVKISAIVGGAGGPLTTFTVTGGIALTVSGSGTLADDFVNALKPCPMPDGVLPGSLTQVSSYVLVSVADSQRFYWIDPGETTIDPLNFASKESSPDPIVHMRTVGDQVMIMGSKSTENWYATGNLAAPFAPIEGRVYARGVLKGTPVVIDDGIVLVGDDGRVYEIGFQPGDSTDTAWGVNRISNNGIEERIRYLIRSQIPNIHGLQTPSGLFIKRPGGLILERPY